MGLLDYLQEKGQSLLAGGAKPRAIVGGLLGGDTSALQGAWNEVKQLGNPNYMRNVKGISKDEAMNIALNANPVFALSTGGKLSDALDDYAMQHRPPMKGDGAPLHDLTGGGSIYPADVYSPKAAQYYGTGNDALDAQSFSIAQQYKNKPDELVTMYRAIPKQLSVDKQIAELEKQKAQFMKRGTYPANSGFSNGSDWYDNAYDRLNELKAMPKEGIVKPKINNGDWVTINKNYAKEHGMSALDGNYKIISQKVPARKLFTNGDSIHEFGYDESGKILPEFLAYLSAGGLLGAGAYKYSQGNQ